jgi:hypothetical protein
MIAYVLVLEKSKVIDRCYLYAGRRISYRLGGLFSVVFDTQGYLD